MWELKWDVKELEWVLKLVDLMLSDLKLEQKLV